MKGFFGSVLILPIMLFYSNLHSQILPADTVFHQKRFAVVASVEGVLYTGSLAWLYSNWYNKFTKSSFHTFNDNTEWLQMDKAGHSFTSYTFGRAAYDLMRYIGVKENKALIFGGGLGLIYLSTVEIFDGVSSSWGFSFGDMAANTFGTALFVSQQMVWKEQRLNKQHNSQIFFARDKELRNLTQRKNYREMFWASQSLYFWYQPRRY